MSIDRGMDKEDVSHVYSGILAIKGNEMELFVVGWMDVETVIQSEVRKLSLIHISEPTRPY